jgi:hypothetical protein
MRVTGGNPALGNQPGLAAAPIRASTSSGAATALAVDHNRASSTSDGGGGSAQGSVAERCYGAGGEEMAASSLHLTMECRNAPAERLEQVPRRPGPK